MAKVFCLKSMSEGGWSNTFEPEEGLPDTSLMIVLKS